MSRQIKFVFSIFLTAILLASCGDKAANKKNVIKPVKYAEIGNTNSSTIRSFNGISKSGTEAKLSFRSNGLITVLNAKIGDVVNQGQLLARLDQKDISLGYEKAKAAVASANSQLVTAKSNLDRVKELYQANSASLTDYEQAKNSYANAQANYETALKSMDIQESQFGYTRIIAPFKGIITAVNADVNEVAQAGSPIFIMNSEGKDLEITVGVPEAYISEIHNGDEVAVTINQQEVKGVVSEVGFSSSGSLTFPVIVKLVNPSDNLRPGMPAQVSFDLNTESSSPTDALIVPVNAVGNDTEGDFAFVLLADEGDVYTIKKQQVSLGELTNEGFVVLDGLKKGDLVATAGLRTLYDGMQVKRLNE